MASVWEVGYSIQDGEGKVSSSAFFLASALTEAQALAESQAIMELIDDLSDGVITGVRLNRIADTSAWALKTSASADANRQEKLRFNWQAGVYQTSFTISSRKKSVVSPGTDTVDTTTGGVPGTLLKVAFLAATTTNLGDETVSALLSAKEVYG